MLLWVLVLGSVIGIVAIVIDLGALRYDRRLDRAAADAGATAGAVNLTGDPDGPHDACETAWSYTVRNLGGDPAGVPSPCAPQFPTGQACDPAVSHAATGEFGSYTITITNPVLDGDTNLMGATSIGGAIVQAVNVTADGTACDRLGVDVKYVRRSFFGGIFGSDSNSTQVHSVARYATGNGGGGLPALIALDPHGCSPINANTGEIIVYNNGAKPGSMAADSDAAAGCSGSPMLDVKNSGSIAATPGTTGKPGELGYLRAVPAGQGYDAGLPGSYTGEFVLRPAPITRTPVDRVYHCGNAASGCSGGQFDPIADLDQRYATSPPNFPSSFSTFPKPNESCSSPPNNFNPGNWLIDCPSFQVKNDQVSFKGNGVILFTGAIDVASNGTLAINTKLQGSTPVLDATGLPVEAPPGGDTTVVVRGGISLQSSTATVVMARTMLYQTTGGMYLQGGPTLRWSPPTTGGLKGLLYWNDSGDDWSIQGGPTFRADGVIMVPNSALHVAGNGTLDATDVQLWLKRVDTQGAARLLLRPDPATAIPVGSAGTRLIR
jgi:hypothetical protein